MPKRTPAKKQTPGPTPPDPLHTRFLWSFTYADGTEVPLKKIVQNFMDFMLLNENHETIFDQLTGREYPIKRNLESEQCRYQAECAAQLTEAHKVLAAALETGDADKCARAAFGFGRASAHYEFAMSWDSLRQGAGTKHGQRASAEKRAQRSQDRSPDQEKVLISAWKNCKNPKAQTLRNIARLVEEEHTRENEVEFGWDKETNRKILAGLKREGKITK